MAHKHSPPLPKMFSKDEILEIIYDMKARTPYTDMFNSNNPNTVNAGKSAELGRIGALNYMELIINLKS